jgi:protein-S-isoprenylcysteine O-methyltransferase Ste14
MYWQNFSPHHKPSSGIFSLRHSCSSRSAGSSLRQAIDTTSGDTEVNTRPLEINRLLELRPPRIAMALTALAAAVHLVTPLGDTSLYRFEGLATALGATGFIVMIQAWWQFRKEQVAICPTAVTHHLITTGIYRVTRNPMYLGMIMMLMGVAVWLGTLPFYLTTGAYFLIINQAFCPYEEAKLRAAFGWQYTNYANRVRRWI